MDVHYFAETTKISEREAEYIKRKIFKVNRLLRKEDPDEVKANIELDQNKRKMWTVSVTIVTPKKSFRVQKNNNDLFKAIDMIEEALMKQIRRQNEKIRDTVRHKKKNMRAE